MEPNGAGWETLTKPPQRAWLQSTRGPFLRQRKHITEVLACVVGVSITLRVTKTRHRVPLKTFNVFPVEPQCLTQWARGLMGCGFGGRAVAVSGRGSRGERGVAMTGHGGRRDEGYLPVCVEDVGPGFH